MPNFEASCCTHRMRAGENLSEQKRLLEAQEDLHGRNLLVIVVGCPWESRHRLCKAMSWRGQQASIATATLADQIWMTCAEPEPTG